jgi:hypothetical protein
MYFLFAALFAAAAAVAAAGDRHLLDISDGQFARTLQSTADLPLEYNCSLCIADLCGLYFLTLQHMSIKLT